MRLKKGHRYRLPDRRVIEVLDVGHMGAVVRPVTRKRREFTANGQLVSFEARSKTFVISANSVIEEVENNGEQ